MKNILIFVGFVLMAVGLLVYYVIGLDSTNIIMNGRPDHSPETRAILQYSIGGFLFGLGFLFTLGGLRARARMVAEQKKINYILQTGKEVQGTVTFVDRNYKIIINKNPIYSIVEYTYQDQIGKTHTRRVETIPSESVIRNKIEVGSTVTIKYLSETPSESTIIL